MRAASRKALRTVPVVLEIADRVRERAASDAWIIDFTNPVGIVTRALLDAGHRAVGLCNVAIGFQRQFACMLGVAPARRRRRPGRPQPPHLDSCACASAAPTCCPQLLADHGDELAGGRRRCRGGCSTSSAAIPSYYLRYFYAHDIVLAEQLDGVPRAAAVAEIERQLLELYRDPAVDEKPRAARAARRRVLQRGGDRARRVARLGLRARSTRSTSATTARSPGSRTTTSSRCPRAIVADGPVAAAPGAARARAARARAARGRVRAARGRGGA